MAAAHVTAVATVKVTVGGFLNSLTPSNAIDSIVKDLIGRSLYLELVSSELDANDKFAWLRDEEFARETLAGVNPYAIELAREFPLRNKLDPAVYGPTESVITTDVLERQMGHVMTVGEAVKQKRLFILDYHDLFLPCIHKIRELENIIIELLFLPG
ncbi:hypothetical protein ACP70R_001506 [Stipagrostis hirtigluma subsp. patula]